jgi:hypothetical protein
MAPQFVNNELGRMSKKEVVAQFGGTILAFVWRNFRKP